MTSFGCFTWALYNGSQQRARILPKSSKRMEENRPREWKKPKKNQQRSHHTTTCRLVLLLFLRICTTLWKCIGCSRSTEMLVSMPFATVRYAWCFTLRLVPKPLFYFTLLDLSPNNLIFNSVYAKILLRSLFVVPIFFFESLKKLSLSLNFLYSISILFDKSYLILLNNGFRIIKSIIIIKYK